MREKYFIAFRFIFWIIINTNLSRLNDRWLTFFKLIKYRVILAFFIDDHVLNLFIHVPSYQYVRSLFIHYISYIIRFFSFIMETHSSIFYLSLLSQSLCSLSFFRSTLFPFNPSILPLTNSAKMRESLQTAL